MSDPRRSTPETATILRTWGRLLKAEVRVGLIGRVTAYDATTRLATVQPIMREQNGEVIAPLRDVRIGALRAGPFVLSLPVAVGDIVDVRFLDYSHDAFLADGQESQAPDARRRHDLSDAIAVPLALGPEAIPNASANDLVIGLADGDGTITIEPSGNVVVESGDIRLGSAGATDPVILLAELQTYITDLNVALTAAVAPPAGGVLTFGVALPLPGSVSGAAKVSGE